MKLDETQLLTDTQAALAYVKTVQRNLRTLSAMLRHLEDTIENKEQENND